MSISDNYLQNLVRGVRSREAANQAVIEDLLDKIKALREASGWRPIATAPKDATKIDVWLQIYDSPRSMGWADAFRVPEAWWQESTKHWVHLNNGNAEPLYTEYVTHWMPMPASPTDSDRG